MPDSDILYAGDTCIHNESGREVVIVNRTHMQIEGVWIEAIAYVTPDHDPKLWTQSVRNFNSKFTKKE